jgi:hypothetical protein
MKRFQTTIADRPFKPVKSILLQRRELPEGQAVLLILSDLAAGTRDFATRRATAC